MYELREKYPDKTFYTVGAPTCADMKKVTLEKVLDCLKNESNEVLISDEIRKKADKALEKMLELAK